MTAQVVLALHDAGGTVPPMLAIADELVGRGHAVTVLGQRSIERRAQRAGCEFVAFSIGDYATDQPIEEQIETVVPLSTGREAGDELLATIEATGADLVVVDANLAGVAAAAEVASCRSAILLHSLFETYVDTWFGELWPLLAPLINETRTAYGLAEAGSWTDVFAPHDRLVAAVPQLFDAPTAIAPPPTLRHAGFLVPAASATGDRFEPTGTDPLVLVSLSTTDMGHGPLLQTILDAIGDRPVHGIVTTGGQRFEPALRTPANVVVHDVLAHAVVLPHTAAVVTHAGLGTVAAALSHGVPIVCTPIARDQPLNASRVAAVGAGVVVPADAVSPDPIGAALDVVLADPGFRAGAQRVADASERAGGAAGVADDLEDLIR